MQKITTGFLILLTIVSLFLLLGTLAGYELAHADRIYPGVWVNGLDVGGLTREEATALIEEEIVEEDVTITLRWLDKTWTARPSDLGMRLDAAATAEAAHRVGRDASFAPLTHLRLLVEGDRLSPTFRYDAAATRTYLEALSEQIDLPAVDAKLSFDGLTPVVTSSQNGRELDVEASLAILEEVVPRFAPAEVELIVREVRPNVVDADTAREEAEWLLSAPFTFTLPNPAPDDPGPWSLPPDQLKAMLALETEGESVHVRVNEDALRGFLEELAPTIARQPVDARFRFDDATGTLTPIEPGRTGRALDIPASLTRTLNALDEGQHTVTLALETLQPRYPDTATAEELGIKDLIVEGESYFIGSPSGRDHNIRLAASKFDGLVIGPGETFSFNEHLGEVTAEMGYDESYVTAGEQLAIEVGGGICQVSTTAFRAAFWGGYPITERWYHHHRVGYYELMEAGVGMDATVYSPQVDFKFRNDREAPLLIETDIEESAHRLVFRFYSTDDGRRVEKSGPEITEETEPAEPIYQLDNDLAPGSVIQWQSAVNGLTATVGRTVYTAEDEVLFRDSFVSRYAPRRAAYHYGPGYEPPQEQPTEEESEPAVEEEPTTP